MNEAVTSPSYAAYPPAVDRPKLKSTYSSKEAEFELDDGELDEADQADLSIGSEGISIARPASIEHDRTPNDLEDGIDGPLLTGLLEDGKARGSVDVPRSISYDEEDTYDPLAHTFIEKGGTLLSGIASRSPSSSFDFGLLTHIHDRYGQFHTWRRNHRSTICSQGIRPDIWHPTSSSPWLRD